MESGLHSTPCLDCGQPLTGKFCSTCGQKAGSRILPLRHLLHDSFHEIWHLDSRFLSTVKALARPGFLTQEFLAGRRTRWFPPFRLYLIASLALFLLLGVQGVKPGEFQLRVSERRTAPVMNASGAAMPSEAAAPSRLQLKAREINRDPGPFLAKFMAWLPRVFFVLLPFFALLLKLAYLRTRTLYAVHAVFSLHEHAFAFLLLALVKVMGFIPYSDIPRGVLMLALPLHLAWALKRVYGQRWPITLVKALVVGLVHAAAALFIVGMTVFTLLWAG